MELCTDPCYCCYSSFCNCPTDCSGSTQTQIAVTKASWQVPFSENVCRIDGWCQKWKLSPATFLGKLPWNLHHRTAFPLCTVWLAGTIPLAYTKIKVCYIRITLKRAVTHKRSSYSSLLASKTRLTVPHWNSASLSFRLMNAPKWCKLISSSNILSPTMLPAFISVLPRDRN